MGLMIQQEGGQCETCGSGRTHSRYCDSDGSLIKYTITDDMEFCPQCGALLKQPIGWVIYIMLFWLTMFSILIYGLYGAASKLLF